MRMYYLQIHRGEGVEVYRKNVTAFTEANRDALSFMLYQSKSKGRITNTNYKKN